ncbi:MAG: short-chain dehydrogenase [Parafilimonas sp.]
MTNEQIDKFLSNDGKSNSLVRISFKTRNSIQGIFIQTPDFNELKSKNFWRIVSEANFEQWKKSKDYNLCRMFNGAEFTKLASV